MTMLAKESTHSMIKTSPSKGLLERSVPAPISQKILWTRAKYDGMARGIELRAELFPNKVVELVKTRGSGDIAEQKSNPRGILRSEGSMSSGRRARFNPDVLRLEDLKDSRAWMFEKSPRSKKLDSVPFQNALQIMMKHRRQLKQTEAGQLRMETKLRGNSTFVPISRDDSKEDLHNKAMIETPRGYSFQDQEIFAKSQEVQKIYVSRVPEKLNEAMIESPRGHGDFGQFSSAPDARIPAPRGVSDYKQKEDFQQTSKISKLEKELATEKMNYMYLQNKLQESQRNEAQWKEKYESMVKNMMQLKTMMKVWIPENINLN